MSREEYMKEEYGVDEEEIKDMFNSMDLCEGLYRISDWYDVTK